MLLEMHRDKILKNVFFFDQNFSSYGTLIDFFRNEALYSIIIISGKIFSSIIFFIIQKSFPSISIDKHPISDLSFKKKKLYFSCYKFIFNIYFFI